MRTTAILAANIKRMRDRRGWSQEELAERSGIHRTYISGLERGKRNPTLSVLDVLAESFDRPAHALLEPEHD